MELSELMAVSNWYCLTFCRLHLALKAYTELLHNLSLMDRSKEEAIKNSAQVIKGKQIKTALKLYIHDVI